ncbi:hypothetical protein, partial [Aphanothece microscopica]|uniref:hypothetical protein n=1 Tax=Aphanothece microscopica TaxID=1049561 RepID=UPI003985393F
LGMVPNAREESRAGLQTPPDITNELQGTMAVFSVKNRGVSTIVRFSTGRTETRLFHMDTL